MVHIVVFAVTAAADDDDQSIDQSINQKLFRVA